MTDPIDDLRKGFHDAASFTATRLQAAKARFEAGVHAAQEDLQLQLAEVEQRIEEGRARTEAAKAEIDAWARQRGAIAQDQIERWKRRAEHGKLEARASATKRHAEIVVSVAGAAADEAERALLQAWLAKADAAAPRSQRG